MYGIDTEYYFHTVLKHALKSHRNIDLILVTGDLTQTPSSSSYQRIFRELKDANIPCICLPGNHDDWSEMQKILNVDNVSCNKQTTLGNWRIICLNSQKPGEAGGRMAKSELHFLDQEIRENCERDILLAVHHNCLPTGSEWIDTMTIENSNELLSILKQYPQVKAIIHGHIHQERQFAVDNLKILSSPSTCFQFKPKSKDFALDDALPGYRYLYLHPQGEITTEVVRVKVA
jgi:Icc protein